MRYAFAFALLAALLLIGWHMGYPANGRDMTMICIVLGAVTIWLAIHSYGAKRIDEADNRRSRDIQQMHKEIIQMRQEVIAPLQKLAGRVKRLEKKLQEDQSDLKSLSDSVRSLRYKMEDHHDEGRKDLGFDKEEGHPDIHPVFHRS